MKNNKSKDIDVEASVTPQVAELPKEENEKNRRARIRREKRDLLKYESAIGMYVDCSTETLIGNWPEK